MKKSLGVLGGMGPLATADFLKKVIELTDVEKETDHLRVYVDNNPQIPDRVQCILHSGQSPVPFMEESLNKLISIGAECIFMPCITAHYFHDELVKKSTVPFPGLPDVVAKACKNNFGEKTAGVLSTEATLKMRIILSKLDSQQVRYITPHEDEQNEITRLIYGVKTNQDMNSIVKDFTKILDNMKARGADYFVLGCTELPVIGNACPKNYEFIDSTLELAKAAVLHCGAKIKLV